MCQSGFMTDHPTTSTRAIVLAARPSGEPTLETFRTETRELPGLGSGQILVKNTAMSVDPYMRGRMNDVKSYVPPFQLDEPLEGGAVGEVVESRSDKFAAGDVVAHNLGWRDYAVVDDTSASRIDTDGVPATAYLGVLGMPGITAYGGLVRAAEFKAGDTVFVSGAAGAVGSLVGQLAKRLGARRVIGSAGSDEKVKRLLDLGFDAAFNYKNGDVAGQLKAAAPDGIDVYFDNVGGEHLEAAIARMNNFGRIAVCGMIAAYNATEPPAAPRNLSLIIGKRITMRGFISFDNRDLMGEFRTKMAEWIKNDEIHWDETFVNGLENAPQAFLDMMNGANTGKMVVRLDG